MRGVLGGSIQIGDEVYAYNEATGEIGLYPVTATVNHTDEIIIHLTIDGELIETTPEHPFYTADSIWIDAGDLEIGELILSLDGDYGVVESVVVITDADQRMYNLTVDEAHTFFVGAGDWLVHNVDCRRVLVLGEEGNYDYARKLAEVHQDWEVIGTSYGFGNNIQNVDYRFTSGNLITLNNVDGARLAQGGLTRRVQFSDIVFNGPKRLTPGVHPWRSTGDLVEEVLDSAHSVLAPGGRIRISSGRGMPAVPRLNSLIKTTGDFARLDYPTRFKIPFLEDRMFGLSSYVHYRTGGDILGTPPEAIFWYIFGH